MVGDTTNVPILILVLLIYTPRNALNGNYHKKRMDMLTYTPMEHNYLEALAKTFIFPARHNQFIQGTFSKKAPFRRIAIAMNANSAFTESHT